MELRASRWEFAPLASLGKKLKVLGPVVATNVRIVLGHALARVAEHASQIFEASAIQTPVAGEAVLERLQKLVGDGDA